MFKKIISFTLTFAVALSMGINVGADDVDRTTISLDDVNFVMPDEQIPSTATLDGEFADDSIIVIFTTEASRNNRNFTASDFSDVGAAKIEDVTRLSSKEYNYVEPVWTAQTQMETMARKDMLNRNIVKGQISSATREAIINYEAVKEVSEENTLINVDEFRRIILIKLAKTGKENVLRAIETLQKRDDIRYVGPNYITTERMADTLTPNDPMLGQQWAVNKINLPEAWDITTGANTVKVGIIDSGINSSHPDLINRVNTALSFDFVTNTGGANTTIDPDGHGTHVAGIVGAQGNNNIGIAGVNCNIQLVSLRVLNEWGGFGYLGHSGVAKAVDYARTNNIPILNASLKIGYNDQVNQPIRDALASYEGLFVQSAGNYRVNHFFCGIKGCEYTTDDLRLSISKRNTHHRDNHNLAAGEF